MRKRRAIIFDDEPVVLDVLKLFFEARGYEVMTFREPIPCVIYSGCEDCERPHPCADIILMDYKMPKMNGLELLQAQFAHGCKLTPKNKALMSGYIDERDQARIHQTGAAYFQKPIDFSALGAWIEGCEKRVDLSVPLAIKRRDARYSCNMNVVFGLSGDGPLRSATALNMSTSGLCLRTAQPLAPLQDILIRAVPPSSHRPALVRWIRETNDGKFIVGLSMQ